MVASPISSSGSSIENVMTAFEQLTVDEQLGLLWVVYDNMGGQITPAAPGAADEQFTQNLLDRVIAMEPDSQLAFMRDLIRRTDTESTREYSSFTNDNKLVFWYRLADLMRSGEVIQMPEGYQLPTNAATVFNSITSLSFNEQITVLRQAVVDMGPRS